MYLRCHNSTSNVLCTNSEIQYKSKTWKLKGNNYILAFCFMLGTAVTNQNCVLGEVKIKMRKWMLLFNHGSSSYLVFKIVNIRILPGVGGGGVGGDVGC
jgi:hypothetical protein